jgi:hypothetical protein
MKARTAKERTVEALTAQYIHPLTDEQIRAAHSVARLNTYEACPGNGKDRGLVWCTDCGNVIDYRPALLINHDEPCICGHCGAKLQGTYDAKQGRGHHSHEDELLVCLAEAHGDWQVFRYFRICSTSRLGQPVTFYPPREVVRRWYNVVHGGKAVVWSCGQVVSGYRACWVAAPLTLKQETERPTYYGTSSYKFTPHAWIPGSTWHKLLTRDGFTEGTARRLNLAPYEIVPVFTMPQLVTLVKAHKYRLARYYSGGSDNGFRELLEDWPSVKVAMRHGYAPKDIQLWHDLLHSLRTLGRDIRSPRWICPENLRAAHDIASNQVARHYAALRAGEKKATIIEEKKYRERISAFLDLSLRGNGFTIAVIPTVEDVRIEGEKMHHCVFKMRYYERATSLLLSARDFDGKRLETIEFDLVRGKVLQSRAACNGTSPQHRAILAVMQDYAATIQQVYRKRQGA